MKKAIITGVTGQDGAYLSDFLLEKGYQVHGIKRRSSSFNTQRIEHLYADPHQVNSKFKLHYGDLTDSLNLTNLINDIKPDEIYNLAAQSHVKVSFEIPEYTANVDALGTLRILEAVRSLKLEDKVKIYQASSSELYGKVQNIPQDESTPFYPRSPYAVAKLYAYWITKNYREAYNIFACNGILFNHESPKRGETFVTRKITRGLSRIIYGLDECIYLGNLDAKRDWGHAKDYVEMMWMILQHNEPDDWVIATGVNYSIREFLNYCFDYLAIEVEYLGKNENELVRVSKVLDKKFKDLEGKTIVKIDPKYYRPTEVDTLLGDSSKARKILGWQPKYSIKSLIKEMLESDIELAHKESLILNNK